jgi:selenide, water dikinase
MGLRRVVLVGGGHAHAHVMRAQVGKLPPGWGVTLVSPGRYTPYSGMLPGFVAGLYTLDEAHIDLEWLAAETGTSLVQARAVGLDRKRRIVATEDGAEVHYDLLSLDVGITPALDAIPGAAEHGIAVKPIAEFVRKFDALRAAALRPGGPRRFAVVGGGAGGVELLLSLHGRLAGEAAKAGISLQDFSFLLVTADDLLATHNARVRDAFRRQFDRKGIGLRENAPVAAIEAGCLVLADGDRIAADTVLVTTHAMAPCWFAGTGLALDNDGFIAVGPSLQSLNDPNVFAAGDCAALVETPREKAGVYAVRAGPPLARNLMAKAKGRQPVPWRPQKRHLALISTGEKYAIASRGVFKAEGAWLWHLKDWIDRRWMDRYRKPRG